jgi:hypothetical protein
MDEIIISNIILSMREFQAKNNIKNQCVTNTQYLYDVIRKNTTNNVKVKAVIVASSNNETNTFFCVGGHLVVELSGPDELITIEPSYDVFSLKDKSYFDNIKDFTNMFKDSNNNYDYDKEQKIIVTDLIEQSIRHFIKFKKLAEQINNGELLICDKEFYNNQADYIETLLNKYLI